jgi:hypothetical protein
MFDQFVTPCFFMKRSLLPQVNVSRAWPSPNMGLVVRKLSIACSSLRRADRSLGYFTHAVLASLALGCRQGLSMILSFTR